MTETETKTAETTQIPYDALVEGTIRSDQQVIRQLESLLGEMHYGINDRGFTITRKRGLLYNTFEIYKWDGYSVRIKTGFGLIFGVEYFVPEGEEESL
ncbi:hypothetical protein J4443_01635 [Candidatus Woesearchaeota archaeon]|nr:hypothetical protein [Candidatus Woesearchaeota archaeon]